MIYCSQSLIITLRIHIGNVLTKVEVRYNKELLLEPTLLKRELASLSSGNTCERCLIEPSINSVRVSVRFKFEDADPIEQILGKKFISFLMKRAEEYIVMRRMPIDVSL